MGRPSTRITNQTQRSRRWIIRPNAHAANATGVVSQSAVKTVAKTVSRRDMNVAAATVRCHQTFSRQIPTHVMHATENTGRHANVLATINYTPSDDRSNDDRCDLSVFLNGRRAEMVDDITTERGIKLYLTSNLSMSRQSVDGDLYIA